MSFHSIPLLLVCPAFFLVFCAAAYAGAAVRRRQSAGGAESTGYVIGAATSLLGLLIAFTFSIALGRYEIRRDLIVREATAVRNVVHRAQLLPAPADEVIISHTRDYLTTRIASETSEVALAQPPLQSRNATIRLQDKLWSTAESLPQTNGPLLDALTELFATADSRASADAEHIPDTVFAVVILMSAGVSAIIGFGTGAVRTIPGPPLLVYLAVLALALTLILDLDQPVRGGIRVSKAPFLELVDS